MKIIITIATILIILFLLGWLGFTNRAQAFFTSCGKNT